MKNRLFSLILGAVLATAAFAEDLSPGLWEITLETRVPGAEEFSPGANQVTQCLSATDARDPARLLGPMSTQGATGCSYTNKTYAGNAFHFAMECSGSFALKTQGDIAFSAGSMNGSIVATGTLSGKTVEFRSKVSARRLGGC